MVLVMDIDYQLGSDADEVRALVRRLAKEKLAPFADQLDEKEEFARSFFDELGAAGLLGILAPEKFGRSDGSFLSATVVCEEIAAVCGGTALSYGAHAVLGIHNLLRSGNENQKQKYLPDLCTGKKLAAWA